MTFFSLHQRSPWLWLTLALWLLLCLGIAQDAARHPAKHNTVYVYHDACVKWWAGQDPYYYNTHQGFFYLPQAAILFTPFTWGPGWLGEITWRAVIFSLFAYALFRLAEVFFQTEDFSRTFFFFSLLALPSSLASLRNGQYDLLIAAFNVLAVAEISQQRWSRTTFWLCFGLAMKPLGAVPLLLFGALYFRSLGWRLLVGLLLTALIPFLVATPFYAAHEYARFVDLVTWASHPGENRFSDLAALLHHTHINLPEKFLTLFRLLAAAAFLGLGFLARQRCSVVQAAWIIGALAAVYLMLFNPRTEACSYVILGPFLASLALAFYPERKIISGWLVFSCIGLASDSFPTVIYHATNLWLKPFLALVFLGLLLGLIFKKRRPSSA